MLVENLLTSSFINFEAKPKVYMAHWVEVFMGPLYQKTGGTLDPMRNLYGHRCTGVRQTILYVCNVCGWV